MRKIYYLILISFALPGCSSESCKINFEEKSDSFNEAVAEIHSLNYRMNSRQPYYKIVKSFTKTTTPIESKIFDQIEFVELHEDGTIIFQAPNCDHQSDFRDEVYFVAYAPLGRSHIEQKRNIGKLKEVEKHWFMGTDISSLAN